MRPVAAWRWIVVAGWLGTTAVAAEPAHKTAAVLSWVRTPGAEACASLPEVAGRVNARLGRVAFVTPTDAKLLIEATIAEDRGIHGFRVHIVLTNDSRERLGTRDLEVAGDDCHEATDAAALAIALMIDPNAASAESEASFPVESGTADAPPSPLPPTTTAPVAPAASIPLSSRPMPSAHWRTRLGLGALASVGQLPGIAVGGFGAVRLSPASGVAGIDVTARYLAEKDEDVRPGVGGTFSASSVGLAGFWAPVRLPRTVFSLFAGAELGKLAANGYNFALRNDYRLTWLANSELGGELVLSVADSFALSVRLGLKVPLVREDFGVAGESTRIFKTSAVMGDLALGVAFAP